MPKHIVCAIHDNKLIDCKPRGRKLVIPTKLQPYTVVVNQTVAKAVYKITDNQIQQMLIGELYLHVF